MFGEGEKDMNKQDYIALMDSLHPGFFQREYIRKLADGQSYAEMLLPLDEFEAEKYDREYDDSVFFGYFHGDVGELKEAVGRVDRDWVKLFNEGDRVYCGYVDGKAASFCLVEDMGIHQIGGRSVKIGGPGCVGTLPEYRHKGIGLTMVRNVTQILKEEGFDYSYIHFTGVAPWYEKLGYQISVSWDKKGIL